MSPDNTEQQFDEIYYAARPYVLKIARSVLLASLAAWLVSAQRHADYSALAVWVIVFLLSIINRYHWVAGLLIVWLVALYLLTPEMVAGLKAMRG